MMKSEVLQFILELAMTVGVVALSVISVGFAVYSIKHLYQDLMK
jgi:uncharacterized membrane protein